MSQIPLITADSLRELLSEGKEVTIIDVRPAAERAKWFIPGSMHIDAYSKLKQKDPTALDDLDLDRSIPIVTVCAAGNSSMVAASILQDKGYKAYSLQDGMKGWSLAWNTARLQFEDFTVYQVRRTGKGCLSYIIASDKEAIILDTSLPVDVYSQIVNEEGFTVKYVMETHIHADHLSRSKEAAGYFHAPLFLPASSKVQFGFEPISDGSIFSIGRIALLGVATPGHTPESFSFYIENKILFTGDTLFTNGVGRPDLKSSEQESREKAEKLYDSLKKLLSFPGDTIILPGHTNEPIDFDEKLIKTTIKEARKNIRLLESSKEEFVPLLLQKIPATPPNYLAIAEKNIAGNYDGVNPVDLEAGPNLCAVS